MRKQFETAVQLQSLIEDYFNEVQAAQEKGYTRPSINGLAQYLNLEKHQLFKEQKNDDFKVVLGVAFLKIENDLETRLNYDFENMESIMDELHKDFGWLPIEEHDRQFLRHAAIWSKQNETHQV